MERRAEIKRRNPEEDAVRRKRLKLRRKRCANCDNRFWQVRSDQRFCCGNCRKQFFANGGNAFGPLKSRLEKMIRKHSGELEKRIRVLENRVAEIESLRSLEALPG
jgi:protein-arginine kinase activator protein McsA